MGNLIRPQVGIDPRRRRVPREVLTVPEGLGAAPIAPSQPGALGAQVGTWIRLPGANFPPAGATPVDEIGDANIAAGGTATLLTYQVPNGVRFRLEAIGFGADDETALAFLSWAITAPDSVNGYVNKVAAIGSIRNVTPITFLAGSSVLVSVVGTSSTNAVVTYRFICRIRGWLYSEEVSS